METFENNHKDIITALDKLEQKINDIPPPVAPQPVQAAPQPSTVEPIPQTSIPGQVFQPNLSATPAQSGPSTSMASLAAMSALSQQPMHMSMMNSPGKDYLYNMACRLVTHCYCFITL